MNSDSEKKDCEKIVRSYKDLPIIKRAFARLKAELPDNLYYHSAAHTEDVMSEAIRFAIEDGLPERDIDLIAVAGAYHDFGFIVRYTENEIYGAEFAALAMEQSGSYSPDDIDLVSQMILDTGLVETDKGLRSVATTRLSAYLIDADLSNLGRNDFIEKTELIAKERNLPIEQVYPAVYSLMHNHSWQTPAAKAGREQQKLQNMKYVADRLTKHQIPEK